MHNVLVLRDPFNLFASRWRASRTTGLGLRSLGQTVVLWKSYAREYLGMTNSLPRRISINYNQWFIDKEYRKTISEAVGLPFSDAGLQVVPDAGRGSSFDRFSYDGKAQEMAVLDRWRRYAKYRSFRRYFQDEELVWLTRLCFGDMLQEAIDTLCTANTTP